MELKGVGLRNEGRVAVMHACTPGGLVPDGWSTERAGEFVDGFAASFAGVTAFHLGQLAVGQVVPGEYALCWCADAAACSFQAFAGRLTVACAAGSRKTASQLADAILINLSVPKRRSMSAVWGMRARKAWTRDSSKSWSFTPFLLSPNVSTPLQI